MARKHTLPLRGFNSDGGSVLVTETEIGCLTQIAGWDAFASAADRLLQTQSLSLPGDYRSAVRSGPMTAWRIAPDRVLIRSGVTLDIDPTDDLVALDLSDARVGLIIEGEGAAGLLARIIALDFSESAFPVETFAQTSLHHVGVLVERLDRDRFMIMVPTTWARSLTDLLIIHLAPAA